MKKLFFGFYKQARILWFQLLSNLKPVGFLDRIQPVQIIGRGQIFIRGRVSIGYFPSPYFFSTYGYLEARNKEAKIEIGNNTVINNGFVAIAEKSIIAIGENCIIGTSVEIFDSDFHALSHRSRQSREPHICEPVRIGNNVFIGSNVKILKGVSIGDGAVIANSSIVTRDIPGDVVALGVPAKVVKKLISS